MEDSKLIFIINEKTDKPIKIVHDDYTANISDGNYIFSKKERVIISSEEQLIEYIIMKLREGYNVNINNKNSSVTIDIKL